MKRLCGFKPGIKGLVNYTCTQPALHHHSLTTSNVNLSDEYRAEAGSCLWLVRTNDCIREYILSPGHRGLDLMVDEFLKI